MVRNGVFSDNIFLSFLLPGFHKSCPESGFYTAVCACSTTLARIMPALHAQRNHMAQIKLFLRLPLLPISGCAAHFRAAQTSVPCCWQSGDSFAQIGSSAGFSGD